MDRARLLAVLNDAVRALESRVPQNFTIDTILRLKEAIELTEREAD